MNRFSLFVLALSGLCIAQPRTGRADDVVFPPNANVINVVRDLKIDNTGQTDVQPQLQKLFDAFEEHGKTRIIYFPKGTYLLGDMLHMRIERQFGPRKEGNHGPYMIGESREGTIFRLKDGTWTRFDRKLPPPANVAGADMKPYRLLDSQVVIHTGDSTNTTFNKIIRNFTVNTGRNNPAAIGVMYCTSNSGHMSDITIVSEDGQGLCGLAMAGAESGPGGVENVAIRGFDVGLYSTTAYSFAVSNLTMSEIGRIGIENWGKIGCENVAISMRPGVVPAIRNRGLLTMVGASIEGSGGGQPAIALDGKGVMYLRDIKTRGFAGAVAPGAGDDLAEHAAGAPVTGLFKDARAALKLPIRKAPEIPYEKDFAKWASPFDYGAKGDDTTDDTEAVQKALSDPTRTHIYLPFGKWAGKKKTNRFVVTRDITVGPHIERIIGLAGDIRAENDARLRVAPGDKPLVIEMASVPALDYDSNRTLVLRRVNFNRRPDIARHSAELRGTGEVFLFDTHLPVLVDHPQQHVWLRHYNNESGPPKQQDVPDLKEWQRLTDSKAYELHVKRGTAWVLGWKSENLRQRAIVEPGGKLEVLCFDNYSWTAAGKKKDGDWPMFRVLGGDFSLGGLMQHGNENNRNLVWETRGGVTRKLTKESNAGGNVALYTGQE